MKISNLFLNLFLLSVVVVLYSMITINIDLFMWSALVADIIGIGGLFINFKFPEKYIQKIW